MGVGSWWPWCKTRRVPDPQSLYDSQRVDDPNTLSECSKTEVLVFLIPSYRERNRVSHRAVGITRLAAQLARKDWPVDTWTGTLHVPWFIYRRKVNLDDEIISIKVYDDAGAQNRTTVLESFVYSTLQRIDVAAGAMFVYDITRQQTWEDSKVMIEAALEWSKRFSPARVKGKLMIVGCKCDLVEEREVDHVAVKEYADERGILFMETSAKENINVEYAFVSFAAQLLETHKAVKDNIRYRVHYGTPTYQNIYSGIIS